MNVKKNFIWKFDIGLSFVIFIGFEMIDQSIDKLQQVPFYYEFLSTAKWLLIIGFAVHGLVNWLGRNK